MSFGLVTTEIFYLNREYIFLRRPFTGPNHTVVPRSKGTEWYQLYTESWSSSAVSVFTSDVEVDRGDVRFIVLPSFSTRFHTESRLCRGKIPQNRLRDGLLKMKVEKPVLLETYPLHQKIGLYNGEGCISLKETFLIPHYYVSVDLQR